MWGIMAQSGVATAVVDSTHTFFPLLVGLYGLLALLAGLIAAVAVQHAWVQATQPAAEPAPIPAGYQQAA